MSEQVKGKEYNSKEDILKFCLGAAKQRVETLSRDSSFIGKDTSIVDLFPENDEGKLNEGQMVGEPARLEYMVECELECLGDKFRIDCEVFFDETLTIDKYSDILWEHRQKEGDEDESIQSKFKDFFQEEGGDDSDESSEGEDESAEGGDDDDSLEEEEETEIEA